MVFSSYLFVFGFLPAFLIAYWLVRPGLRNGLILVASLLFYYLGDAAGMLALVAAILINYAVGAAMGAVGLGEPRETPRRRGILVAGLVLNVGILGWYKYAGFVSTNLDLLATRLGRPEAVPVLDVALPMGVSFFVFQGISYLIDVYRGEIAPTRNVVTFGAYKSLFPQLIAGPIVRYEQIAEELKSRVITETLVVQGITRFLIGFAKKVLLADTFAVTADAIFALPADQLSTGTAWLGALAYTLQIYFDFSAYSDMAIGLGMMMGFRFPENFNYPYIATSIRLFWRRWHMTLSSWFRDYVYIPLGGNRVSARRTYLNLLIVFALTGLWHGAAWTFVVWGLWHGAFSLFERATNFEERGIPVPVRWVYTMAVVIFGWVLFRAETFSGAAAMMRVMLGLEQGSDPRPFGEFWNGALGLALLAGVVLSMPVYQWLKERLEFRPRVVFGTAMLASLFVLSSMKVLAGAYSPFLYFRF